MNIRKVDKFGNYKHLVLVGWLAGVFLSGPCHITARNKDHHPKTGDETMSYWKIQLGAGVWQ